MQSRIGKSFYDVLEGCVVQKADHIIHCDIYGLCYHLHDFYQHNGAVPVNDSKSEKKWLSLSVAGHNMNRAFKILITKRKETSLSFLPLLNLKIRLFSQKRGQHRFQMGS